MSQQTPLSSSVALAPWVAEDWLGANFDPIFSVDVPRSSSDSLGSALRRTFIDAGFDAEWLAQVDRGADRPGQRQGKAEALYERLSEPDRRTAARDLLMPDGSYIVVAAVVGLGLCETLLFASGADAADGLLALPVIIGLPLCVLALWLAARTRRLVRTIGVRVDFMDKPGAAQGDRSGGLRLTVEVARLTSKLAYPEPTYDKHRTLVSSDAYGDAGPMLSQIKSRIEALGSGVQ
jgi:hypothetical protein